MTESEMRVEVARVEQRLIDFKEAHLREHEILQAQVAEARKELWTKLGEMNEIRRQINDERTNFEGREHSEAVHNAMSSRLSAAERATTSLQGRVLGVGSAITVFLVLIEIALRLIGK
jgi:hypothetical protein